MRTHIDWLTFTMTMQYQNSTPEGYASAVERAFAETFDQETIKIAFGGEWEKNEKGRAPYTDSWKLANAGITLFASPNLTHCCVEVSGQGCERLISHNVLERILAAVSERVTRIDIASDIETETKPAEFVEQVTHERMRASGYQRSETGETSYIGSQKSDRYARVYRYYPPHPRCNLLRVEHVFRRRYAKSVVNACLSGGVETVAQAAGIAFGWHHASWQPERGEGVDISIAYPERKMGGTVFWLIKSCAPAFRRMVAGGMIKDPEQFLRTYFLEAE